MKKVFISRNLSPQSIFLKELTEVGFEVKGESLIELEGKPFGDFPPTDWVFFYSKNAVRFFEKGISKELKSEIIESIQIAVIGESTGKLAEKIFGKCDFIGDGNPEKTAESFLKIAKNQSVLFPRASNSRQSIQKILADKIEAFDLVVYKNKPRSDFELPHFDALVFTSPMNVKAYFSKKSLTENQSIISIGKTTAKSLKKLGLNQVILSPKPTEGALVETVKAHFPPSS
jgi:uroporphyrinogen-III synthase